MFERDVGAPHLGSVLLPQVQPGVSARSHNSQEEVTVGGCTGYRHRTGLAEAVVDVSEQERVEIDFERGQQARCDGHPAR